MSNLFVGYAEYSFTQASGKGLVNEARDLDEV